MQDYRGKKTKNYTTCELIHQAASSLEITSSAEGAVPASGYSNRLRVYATEVASGAIPHNLHGKRLTCGRIDNDARFNRDCGVGTYQFCGSGRAVLSAVMRSAIAR